jgi:hypothetical protein
MKQFSYLFLRKEKHSGVESKRGREGYFDEENVIVAYR